MKPNRTTAGPVTLALLLAAQPVAAHTLSSVSSGLAHPFLGIDHVLAMLAVGLWAVQLGGSALWKVPLAFVFTLLIGAWIGMTGVPVPYVEALIALSVLVLGLAIGLHWRLGPLLASLTVASFALFHGYAHGSELPLAAAPLTYCAGFAVATVVLHALGAATGYLLFARVHPALVRIGGMGLAGSGLLLFMGL